MNTRGHIKPAPSYERILRVFADVHPHEGATSLILVANIYLILVAFYLVKPVRDGWLSITEIGDMSQLEIKAYSAFAQSLLLLGILPLYARLAARLSRHDLIMRVGIVFAVLLVAFWLSQPHMLLGGSPLFGILFYLFVGIFSVILVAQFWAFTTDLYGAERGERLFPLIAVGAALGATTGAWLGRRLVALASIDAFDLILVALLPLLASLALASVTDRRGAYGQPSKWTTERWNEAAAPDGRGPFRLIFQHRYLTVTALMIMVFTWVVTSGDNILFSIVRSTLAEELAHLANTPLAFNKALQEATVAFYGDLYFWINLVTLILQAFVVSRILSAGGMRALLYTTPFISLAAYISMAFVPILGLIKVLKVAENSSTLSIHNTARHMLWLPTSKQMLYQAKPTVDTLFVRLGDGMAALTILIGTRVFHLGNVGFVIFNIGLVLVWIALSTYLHREHDQWKQAAILPPARDFSPTNGSTGI